MAESLRARKREQTRESILATALRLFRRNGYEATTISDIAVAAKVSRSTVFRYFSSKEQFLFADHAARVGLLRAEITRRIETSSAFDALRDSFLALSRFWVEHADQILATRRVINSSPELIAHDVLLDRDWEAIIEDALQRDLGVQAQARFETQVLAGALMGAIRAALRQWDESGGRVDLVALAARGFDILEPAKGFQKRRVVSA